MGDEAAHAIRGQKEGEPWEGRMQVKAESALKFAWGDFPGGPVVRNPPCKAGNMSLIPGCGSRSPTCRGASRPTRHH